MRVFLVIFHFTTYIAPETLRKKIQPPQSHFHDQSPELPKPLSFTSITTVPEHRRRIFPVAYTTHLESTPSSTGAVVHRPGISPPNLETIHSSNALFRSRFNCGLVHPTGAALPMPSSTAPDLAHQLPRSVHLNRFNDAPVHEPDLLNQRRRARVYESYREAHPYLLLSPICCFLQDLAVAFCRCDELA